MKVIVDLLFREDNSNLADERAGVGADQLHVQGERVLQGVCLNYIIAPQSDFALTAASEGAASRLGPHDKIHAL